jgi:hypothetical protein
MIGHGTGSRRPASQKKTRADGAGRTARRDSASGDVHGHFETEAQVSSSGLGPHGCISSMNLQSRLGGGPLPQRLGMHYGRPHRVMPWQAAESTVEKIMNRLQSLWRFTGR